MKNRWMTFARHGLIRLAEEGGDGGGIDAAAESPGDLDPEASEQGVPLEGEEALGDPGKKALDAMKAKERAARQRAQAAEDERDRLKAAAEGREAEWEAERKADGEREKKFRDRYLKAEMRTAAKGVLADPDDAFKFIDLSDFEVSEDGDVDASAISAAVEELIETKPYLAVQDGRRFSGSADAGPRKGDTPRQWTQQDLDHAAAEGRHAEIEDAREKGLLNTLLGRK